MPREKMKQILLAHGLSKETVTDIIMLKKNTNAMVHLPDSDFDFFDIVNRVLQGDIYISTIYVYNLPRVRTMNINRSNKRKWFHI